MALSRRPTYKNNAESSQQQQQPQETEKKCDISCVQNSQILIEKLKSLACRSEVKEDQTSVTVMKVVAEEGMSGNQQIITIESDGMGTQNIADDLESAEICTETYFIEPLAWMKDVHKNVQGKLHCPKCSSKLGSFSWIMGLFLENNFFRYVYSTALIFFRLPMSLRHKSSSSLLSGSFKGGMVQHGTECSSDSLNRFKLVNIKALKVRLLCATKN